MSNFITNTESYREAIRLLTLAGYDVGGLRAQHALKEADYYHRQPTAADLAWQVHTPLNPVHLLAGGKVPTLSVFNLVQGYQYQLSSGMRDFIRDKCGLTPTQTVTITELHFFPNTRIVCEMVVTSNLHIPSTTARKHLLTQWRCTDFTTFMAESQMRDNAKVAATNAENAAKSATPKATKEPSHSAARVASILADY